MNKLRQTENIEQFTRMALRFGCTMKQAYALARWFDLFLAYSLAPKDPERDYIQVHEEPDWASIAAEAGTTADVGTWAEWMNQVLDERESEARA
jgi:hypothetical protein